MTNFPLTDEWPPLANISHCKPNMELQMYLKKNKVYIKHSHQIKESIFLNTSQVQGTLLGIVEVFKTYYMFDRFNRPHSKVKCKLILTYLLLHFFH